MISKPKYRFTVLAARWFDRINGNTYHSAQIIRNADGALLFCPFQYGYGNQYRCTALSAMAKAGWLPPKYLKQQPNGMLDAFHYERDNNYPIFWTVSDGLKRDCVANGMCA